MSRKEIPCDERRLREAIADLEHGGPLENLNKLHIAAANRMVEAGYPLVTPAIVMLRIKGWNIPTKTVKGKRGRAIGSGPVVRKPRESGKLVRLFNYVPDKYRKLVKRIEAGSLKAAIKLKCMDCQGFETSAPGLTQIIRECPCTDCPLHSVRPYR